MKIKIFLIIILFFPFLVRAQTISERLSGRIVLSVEENGEAWYINPDNYRRYYLGRPADAFSIMRSLGLGISEQDFENFKNGVSADLSGKILLRAEASGESYYVNPLDLKMYSLGRPADAFSIMRKFGLGISKNDLENISQHMESEVKQGTQSIYYTVPFTSQAPNAEWSDSVFQDGCEEASALMAVYWARGNDFSGLSTRSEIINISNWEKEKFDEFRDISIDDTAIMIKGYFNYPNIEILKIKDADNLVLALKRGVLIAPMDGQALGNIHFTPPGPINHMLLITGYDVETGKFTTNDPGTRNGYGYKYSKNVLYNAIRDYPTGSHEPNYEIVKKIILVKT